jgi:FecR protein
LFTFHKPTIHRSVLVTHFLSNIILLISIFVRHHWIHLNHHFVNHCLSCYAIVKRLFPATAIGFCCLELIGASIVQANDSLQFQVHHHLSIQKITGTVWVRRGHRQEPANIGDQLKAVGDGIQTGPRSAATLTLDTNAGTLEVAAATVLRIQQMQTSPKGGYRTRLLLSQGQVRVKLKTLVNPESHFEIQTPSSVSGVRGTEFGVAVQPTGDTAIAIVEGKVAIMVPNAPHPPLAHPLELGQGEQAIVPIGGLPRHQGHDRGQPELSLTWLSPVTSHRSTGVGQAGAGQASGMQVRIAGSTSPLNLLHIANQPLAIGQDGRFDYVLPLPPNRRISVWVITPLGSQRHYELVVSA